MKPATTFDVKFTFQSILVIFGDLFNQILICKIEFRGYETHLVKIVCIEGMDAIG